jgi:hypothetical protein
MLSILYKKTYQDVELFLDVIDMLKKSNVSLKGTCRCCLPKSGAYLGARLVLGNISGTNKKWVSKASDKKIPTQGSSWRTGKAWKDAIILKILRPLQLVLLRFITHNLSIAVFQDDVSWVV